MDVLHFFDRGGARGACLLFLLTMATSLATNIAGVPGVIVQLSQTREHVRNAIAEKGLSLRVSTVQAVQKNLVPLLRTCMHEA